MDQEFLKWLATLGVGGVLAGIMFFYYRKDVAQYTNLWKGQSEALLEVVKENTKVITQLIEAVDALHRRLDRDREDRKRIRRNEGGPR